MKILRKSPGRMKDDSGTDRKKQSLLSLGAAAGDVPRPRGGSLLSAASVADGAAAERHRAARARREAPSPLLEALAAMEGFKATPTGAGEGKADAEPTAADARSRWSLSNLLSRKTKAEQPEPKPAWQPPLSPTMPVDKPADPLQTPAENVPPADDAEIRVEPQPGPTEGAEWLPLIDPLQVIGGVTRSVPLIVTMTVLGAAIGVMVALSTPKQYLAYDKLLIDPRAFKFSDRDLTESGLPSDATLALIENEVEIITSNVVLDKVVDHLKLYEDPEFNGQGAAGIGDIVGALRSLLSNRPSSDEDPRRAIAAATLAKSLTVERDEKRFTVTVSARTEEPEKSAQIVNEVYRAYLARKAELRKKSVGGAAGELTSRLEELQTDLKLAEQEVEKYRAEHDLIDAQGRLISDDELVKLNDQLAIARAHTIELNARAASARAVKVDAVIGSGLPEEVTSPVMSELRSQYAAIKQQADQLSVRVGPRHPQYLAMQAQLNGARVQIANELQRIVRSVQTELRRAVQQEQDLAARLAQLKVRATDVNGDLVNLRQLEREAAAKRSVYENYLLRAKEATEQSTINTANIVEISPAVPPLESIGPSRAIIAVAGAALGFLTGIGLGMLRGIYASLRDSARPARRRPSVAPAAIAMLVEGPIEEDPSEPPPPASAPAPTLRQARVDAARRAVEAVRAKVAAEPSAEPSGSARRVEQAPPPVWEARPAPRGESAPRPKRQGSEEPRSEARDAGDRAPAQDQDAAMSPLVRLMRRMRLPSVTVAGHPESVPANTSADDEPAKGEQEATYPYPQRPYAAPQPNRHPQQAAPHPHPAQAWPQPASSYPQAAWPQPAPYAPPAPPPYHPQQSLPPYPPAYLATQTAPQPVSFPYPQPPQSWQLQPVAGNGYPRRPAPFEPYPAAPQHAAWPHDHAGQPDPRVGSREMSAIEEVRESLRELREAILDLAADRARRRNS